MTQMIFVQTVKSELKAASQLSSSGSRDGPQGYGQDY